MPGIGRWLCREIWTAQLSDLHLRRVDEVSGTCDSLAQMAAAWTRRLSCLESGISSLPNTDLRCASTVRSESTSSAAIPALLRPAASNRKTSLSRPDSADSREDSRRTCELAPSDVVSGRRG